MSIIKYILILFLVIIYSYNLFIFYKSMESFDNSVVLSKKNQKFPYRFFVDENNNILPIVAITSFFRNIQDKNRYNYFINNNIKIIGITAYKSFPIKIRDVSEDKYHLTDDFDYIQNIQNWLCCFQNSDIFTNKNNLINMSESDFYDSENINSNIKKKYDFIYICNKDDNKCPLDGWNAINRNYDLALRCLPIMINEYKLKGLIVGRVNCGLEELYKDNIEVTDFLEYHILQKKMRQSRFLFVPNIYDASPRVIAECLIKNVPVIMNKQILCGFKYINYETGNFFNDDHDIRNALDNLLSKIDIISPQKWWAENYSIEKSSIKLRNYLYNIYPDILKNTKSVKFII